MHFTVTLGVCLTGHTFLMLNIRSFTTFNVQSYE